MYRHENYGDLIEKTKNIYKQIETLKDQLVYGQDQKQRKKNERMLKVLEENYKAYHRELVGMKGRMNLGFALFSMAAMYWTNQWTSGKVVAAMPFQPMSMISSMSHRGLDGSDNLYEASGIFIGTLFTMACRGLISKILGMEPPRMPMDHQTP